MASIFHPLFTRSGLLPTLQGQPDSGIEVNVQRLRHQGRPLFEIRVSGLARASPQVCWRVLTGYDLLQDFVPGLLSSTLLSRNGTQVVLEQNGVAGFLFLQQAIHLVVEVTEQPFSTLDICLVAGDMQHYASHWELQPVAQGSATRISYFGSMVPDFFVPPLLGSAIMRAEVGRMMTAVVAEIGKHSGV